MKKASEWFLYVTSLFPLYILLLCQNIKFVTLFQNPLFLIRRLYAVNFGAKNSVYNVTILMLFLLIIVSVVFKCVLSHWYKQMMDKKKKDSTEPEKSIKTLSLDRVDTMSYVGTYIVPLLTVNLDDVQSIFTNVLLLLFLGKFYVMNGQVFINPLFNICGFNVYRSGTKYIITRNNLEIMVDYLSKHDEVYSDEIMPNLFLMSIPEE